MAGPRAEFMTIFLPFEELCGGSMECSLAVCLGLISRLINYYCTLFWFGSDYCPWKRPAPPLLKFWLMWRGGALKLLRFWRSAVDFLPEPDTGDCTNCGYQMKRILLLAMLLLKNFGSRNDEIGQSFIDKLYPNWPKKKKFLESKRGRKGLNLTEMSDNSKIRTSRRASSHRYLIRNLRCWPGLVSLQSVGSGPCGMSDACCHLRCVDSIRIQTLQKSPQIAWPG